MTPTLSVSEFVAVFNQSMQMILPDVNVRGELANLRISKNAWVYFDLKDEKSSLKFFGPVTVLPGPLEDGMNLEVNGSPWLHNIYGFSVNARSIKVTGEGSIAKAKSLLAKKLEAEGLFSQDRKRPLPYPPGRIALITSFDSAAYSDFIKIINARWGNLTIEVLDCLVQGASAPEQIIRAVNFVSQMADPPEALVLIRGGGSEDDLAAFSDERVVRAISSSRVPTLIAIGHERNISLAELASDQRASTPSNAAELLVPDGRHEKSAFEQNKKNLQRNVRHIIEENRQDNLRIVEYLYQKLNTKVEQERINLDQKASLINALNPKLPLDKGYALIRNSRQKQVRGTKDVKIKEHISIELIDGELTSEVVKINELK
ncbi:exodeoxyribonuclease VII large subunit [Candidatus Parcubacteria bacterium]|nr:exodeoxyribonuclease VII large subunit [Candidatus Parcubacteria bacterium]